MALDDGAPAPPEELSSDTIEVLDELDEAQLRAVIDYARSRLRYVTPRVSDQIEPREGEEIVRIEERGGYIEVVKREPCAEGCEDCPHEPVLYHVRKERQPDGTTNLHWTYLGQVY